MTPLKLKVTAFLCLEEIGETPVMKSKLSQQKYPKHKVQRISVSIKRTTDTLMMKVK